MGSGLSNSVSFRSGSNIEFAGPSFVNTGPSAGAGSGQESQGEYGLQDVSTSSEGGGKRDFSNPMYEAMGTMESQAEAAAVAGNFQIPSASGGSSSPSGASSAASGSSPASTLPAGSFMEPPSAILAPSSVTHTSSPQLAVRQKELAPSTMDTGKDTQCLVVDEDDSEC